MAVELADLVCRRGKGDAPNDDAAVALGESVPAEAGAAINAAVRAAFIAPPAVAP